MMVASCSKGITATVLAVLVERGELDPEERVTAYWPEFAAAGKDRITTTMVASHTAGLPFPPLGTGLSGLDLHRGEAVTRALAAAHPLWKPGTAMAYHPVTYGTLLDVIVRRATGASIGSHVRRLIAEPLGVDMWIGAPEEVIPRVIPGQWEESSPMEPAEEDPEPGSYAALRQVPAENPPMDPTSPTRTMSRTIWPSGRRWERSRTPARWPRCMPRCSGPLAGCALTPTKLAWPYPAREPTISRR
jgi:CubicO group peptidase (beta-lactamase class C family)